MTDADDQATLGGDICKSGISRLPWWPLNRNIQRAQQISIRVCRQVQKKVGFPRVPTYYDLVTPRPQYTLSIGNLIFIANMFANR